MELAALEDLEARIRRCLEQGQQATAGRLALGELLTELVTSRLFRLRPPRVEVPAASAAPAIARTPARRLAPVDAWILAAFGLQPEQARSYRLAAARVDRAAAAGRDICLSGLVVLGRFAPADQLRIVAGFGPVVPAAGLRRLWREERERREALAEHAERGGPLGPMTEPRRRGGPLGQVGAGLDRQLRALRRLQEAAAQGALALPGPDEHEAWAALEVQSDEIGRLLRALRQRADGEGPAGQPGDLMGEAHPRAPGPAAAHAADEEDPLGAELGALLDSEEPQPRVHRHVVPPPPPAPAPRPESWLRRMGPLSSEMAFIPGGIDEVAALMTPDDPPAREPARAAPQAVVAPGAADLAGRDDGTEYAPAPPPPAPLPCALPADFDDPALPHPILRTAAIALGRGGFSDFGLLGLRYKSWEPLGLSYQSPFALGFFGVPGSGKSYALGAVIEGALGPLRAINHLRRPHCVLSLHYHPAASYEPELLAAVHPNPHPTEARVLTDFYGALPQGLRDVVVLTLPERVAEMRRRHPHCQVHGLRFALRELGTDGLRTLLGLDLDRAPHYAQQVEALLRKERGVLTWNRLLRAIAAAPFDRTSRRLLIERLSRVRPWIDDRGCLRDFARPGRLVQVDLRAEWLPRELAMTLFSLCLRVFAFRPAVDAGALQHGGAEASDAVGAGGAAEPGGPADAECAAAAPVLVAFDEAHKFTGDRQVRALMEALIRERRHLGTSLVLASQDPLSVPQELLALLDGVGLFRHDSQPFLRHLSRACAAFRKLPVEATARLKPGLMWFWSSRWQQIERGWEVPEGRPVLIATRPRLSRHGGT